MKGSYLLRTASGRYRFRIRIPTYIDNQLGIKEIRKSLETDSLELATLHAAKLAAAYKLAFANMKNKKNPTQAIQDSLSTELITFLDANSNPVSIDFGGDAEKEIEAARELMSLSQRATLTHATPSPQTMLSEAVSRYLAERKLRGVTERSLDDYRAMLDAFIELHGDQPLSQVTRESITETFAKFRALPPNRSKMPEFRQLSLEQILAKKPAKTVSDTTANKFIVRVSQLFNWCVHWELMVRNPAEGLSKKNRTGRASEERLPFEDHELSLLFGTALYQNCRFKHNYQYWVPLIALYSGARLNEICQLRTEDIQHVDGTLCFNLTPAAGRLKNRASERYIPVHSKLKSLGIEAFRDSQARKGAMRLFSEIKPGREGHGQNVSKWFAYYRKKNGINGNGKTFHSFRHTVATRLTNEQRCQPYELDDLLGHESERLSTSRYRSRLLPEHISNTVEKLIYRVPEIDSLKSWTDKVSG